jgi:hypothetical protein
LVGGGLKYVGDGVGTAGVGDAVGSTDGVITGNGVGTMVGAYAGENGHV